MTRTQLATNGEQQRVTVERDFRNEAELNMFLKEFQKNISKTTSKQQSAKSPSNFKSHSFTEDFARSPGYIHFRFLRKNK